MIGIVLNLNFSYSSPLEAGNFIKYNFSFLTKKSFPTLEAICV